MEFIPLQIWQTGLVFARIGAIIMLAPGIGDSTVPPRIRLTIALIIAAIIAPMVSDKIIPIPSDNGGMFLAIGIETMIGLVIGLCSRMLFSALATAGTIVGAQTGMSFAMSFDAAQGQQGAIFGTFFSVLGTVLVLNSNAHFWFINGALNSYNSFAANGSMPIASITDWVIKMFSNSFLVAIQMTIPLIIYGIIFNIAVGILNRAAPAIQVFFIAQPVQILAGLVVFMLTFSAGMMFWLEAVVTAGRELN